MIFIAFTVGFLQNYKKLVAPVNRISDRFSRPYNRGAGGEGGGSGTLKGGSGGFGIGFPFRRWPAIRGTGAGRVFGWLGIIRARRSGPWELLNV